MKDLTQAQLNEFRCTENYFKTFMKHVVYTDGAQFFFSKGECYWLLDLILFELLPAGVTESFITVELEVKGSKASLRGQDGNGNYFFRQAIPYTDMNDGLWKLFIEDGECGDKQVKVILLPSEH